MAEDPGKVKKTKLYKLKNLKNMMTIIKNFFEKFVEMFQADNDMFTAKYLVDSRFTDPSLAYMNGYDFNYEMGCPGFVPWY